MTLNIEWRLQPSLSHILHRTCRELYPRKHWVMEIRAISRPGDVRQGGAEAQNPQSSAQCISRRFASGS